MSFYCPSTPRRVNTRQPVPYNCSPHQRTLRSVCIWDLGSLLPSLTSHKIHTFNYRIAYSTEKRDDSARRRNRHRLFTSPDCHPNTLRWIVRKKIIRKRKEDRKPRVGRATERKRKIVQPRNPEGEVPWGWEHKRSRRREGGKREAREDRASSFINKHNYWSSWRRRNSSRINLRAPRTYCAALLSLPHRYFH